MIFVSVTELTVSLTLNRPKNNSGELTDKHPFCYFRVRVRVSNRARV